MLSSSPSSLVTAAQHDMATPRPIIGIDAHAHVFTQTLALAPDRRYAPSYDASLAQYQQILHDSGLSHGVLVQPSFLGNDNRFLIDCIAPFPDLLRGIVMADPVADLAALPAWHRAGIVGVRANLIGQPLPDFAAPHWQTFLHAMAALDWHLEVQVDAQRLADIAAPVLNSGVRLVVDHFGRLDPMLGVTDPGFNTLLGLASTQRVWVKVSAAYRIAPKGAGAQQVNDLACAAYRPLRDAFGTERLVWGSDWPHTQFETTENPQTAHATLRMMVSSDAERQALLIDTPAELFHFRR